MIDKATKMAIEFLRTIEGFLSDSEIQESNFDVLQQLSSEKGYVSYELSALSPQLIADIINTSLSCDYDQFEPHIDNILRRLVEAYKFDEVFLDEDFIDTVLEQEFAIAEEEWNEYLADMDPVTSEDYYHKAWLHAKNNDYENGLACFKKAVEENRNDLATLKGTAWSLIKMGRIAEAGVWYREALQVAERESTVHEKFELHFDVGSALKEKGYNAKAIEQFALAVKAIKKVMLYAPIICDDGNLLVEADETTTLDLWDIIDYVSQVVSELENIRVPKASKTLHKKVFADIRVAVLTAERAVSEGLIK